MVAMGTVTSLVHTGVRHRRTVRTATRTLPPRRTTTVGEKKKQFTYVSVFVTVFEQ